MKLIRVVKDRWYFNKYDLLCLPVMIGIVLVVKSYQSFIG